MALRVILNDCRPALLALGTAMVMLAVVIRASGCRLNLRRLGELHRCQKKHIQSSQLKLAQARAKTQAQQWSLQLAQM